MTADDNALCWCVCVCVRVSVSMCVCLTTVSRTAHPSAHEDTSHALASSYQARPRRGTQPQHNRNATATQHTQTLGTKMPLSSMFHGGVGGNADVGCSLTQLGARALRSSDGAIMNIVYALRHIVPHDGMSHVLIAGWSIAHPDGHYQAPRQAGWGIDTYLPHHYGTVCVAAPLTRASSHTVLRGD